MDEVLTGPTQHYEVNSARGDEEKDCKAAPVLQSFFSKTVTNGRNARLIGEGEVRMYDLKRCKRAVLSSRRLPLRASLAAPRARRGARRTPFSRRCRASTVFRASARSTSGSARSPKSPGFPRPGGRSAWSLRRRRPSARRPARRKPTASRARRVSRRSGRCTGWRSPTKRCSCCGSMGRRPFRASASSSARRRAGPGSPITAAESN